MHTDLVQVRTLVVPVNVLYVNALYPGPGLLTLSPLYVMQVAAF